MRFFFVLVFFTSFVSAAPIDVCSPAGEVKYFLSQWKERSDPVDVLSRVEGDNFSVEQGKIVSDEDLNGDGINDFIFVSFSSGGSSGDFIYGFLVQCQGFLRHVGGDYFADVKVLNSQAGKSPYKDIQIYSYDRDKQDQIKYKNGQALTTPHVWHFNPETKQYEGESR